MSEAQPSPAEVQDPSSEQAVEAPAEPVIETVAPVDPDPQTEQLDGDADPQAEQLDPVEPGEARAPTQALEAVSLPEPSEIAPPAEVRPPSRSTLRVRGAARATNRPALIPPIPIPIEAIEPDETFQLRDTGDIAGLATSLARVGQLFPIDVRPRGGSFQVVSGFRRLAAVKFLQRATVLARVHEELSDSDAWAFALAQALESRGLAVEEIHALRERLENLGQLTPMNRGLIEAALTVPGSDLEPEDPSAPAAAQEVDLDELAADLDLRLTEISADLSLITELWNQLERGPRQALLDQLRYYGELHAYLSRLR